MKNRNIGYKAKQLRMSKDKQLLLQFVVTTIEKSTGLSYEQLKERFSQEALYRLGLYYFPTTNKTICEALNIPVEAGTRRKRSLEKKGLLKKSQVQMLCPFTKHFAFYLSTDPKNTIL